ncbi:MAG: tail fiber domain-containing protein, partial [Clostridiales bacterium]|nr:tail fiber domain-containing protein [Clostridiales bacterium]
WLYLTEISRDIQNIDKNKITLSGNVQTGRTLTSQTQGTQEAIKKIPSKSSILEAAKKNALEILNGTEGGYVTFETNADDQITELRIANNLDINQATKCWKWNLGGLGYMSRDTASDPWAVVTAATMDGEIVADFITTGTMLADRILGGTLKLGGYNNENGIAEVYDSDNVAIVRLDGQGVYLNPKGRIGSEEGFAQIFIERGGFSCKVPVPCYVNGEINPNPTTFGGLTYGTRTVHNVSGWNDSPSILCLYAANDLRNAIVVAQAVPGGNAQVSHVAVRWNIIQIVGSGGGVIAQFGESEYDYWNGLSDRNKKKNIKDVPVKESKNIIKQLRPRSFNFRKSSSLDSDKKHIGFIAQEVQEIEGINDGIVLEQASGDLSLGYREIIPHLVNVVNEQQKEIDALKEELKKIKEGR